MTQKETLSKETQAVSQEKRQIVISKENAVFRMDKNGNWHNEHGKFAHPKIIKYFNSAIKKDENGYYVHQATDAYEEKVYFPYEDTALFVVDIIAGEEFILLLNTSATLALDPGLLSIKNDNLYIQTPEHRIKFSEKALLKISKFIHENNGQLSIEINGTTYPVK